MTATPAYSPAALPTARAIWKASDAVLSGANIVSIPDSSGSGAPALVPGTLGDATYTSSNADFGGATADYDGSGYFLKTASAVDLSSFEIVLVAKIAATSGFYYLAYALTLGPTQYAYWGHSRISQNIYSQTFDVLRGGANTTTSGSTSGALFTEDIAHIHNLVFDGTAAGSGFYIDTHRTVPDSQETGQSTTGNAGTTAWSVVLHILTDSSGTFGKAASVAEVRLYPPLTVAERRAVYRELNARYPYAVT
jgi:hypothetical protein